MSNAARIDVPSIAKYRIHRAHWLPPNTSGRRPPNSLGSSNPLNTPTKVMAAREVAQPSVTSTVPSAVLSPPSRMAVHFTNSISPQKAGLRIPIARPRWSFRRVLVLVFTILSMVSVVYISVASANYLNYYPSLGSIDQQISSVVYRRDAVSNQTSIVSHIIVDNPTDYSGFKVKLFDLKIHFSSSVSSSNTTLFTIYPLTGSQSINKPLPPHSQMSGDVLVIPPPEQAAQLADFNATNYPLIAHCSLTVDVSTFLDPVTGFVLYDSEQAVQLA